MPGGQSSYLAPLYTSQTDGSALSNSTTPTSLLPSYKYTIPANFLSSVGMPLKVTATGRISTVVTTPGTLTLDLRFGSIIVATSSAMTLSTTAKTNVTWKLDWDLTVRAVSGGTSANLMHSGIWTSEAAGATTTAGEAKTIAIPTSAPAVGTGFDSGSAYIFDFFATWSVANGSNSITCHQLTLWG